MSLVFIIGFFIFDVSIFAASMSLGAFYALTIGGLQSVTKACVGYMVP